MPGMGMDRREGGEGEEERGFRLEYCCCRCCWRGVLSRKEEV